MDNQPLSFPEWKHALANAGLDAAAEAAYQREIITLLRYCKSHRVPVTVPLAKQYVEQQEPLRAGPVRAALRWFVRAARTSRGSEQGEKATAADGGPAGTSAGAVAAAPSSPAQPLIRSRSLRPMEPKPAEQDVGGPDWERALVKTMRLRGLLWRTEPRKSCATRSLAS